jgi:glutaminyl-peptide cyclotransferase
MRLFFSILVSLIALGCGPTNGTGPGNSNSVASNAAARVREPVPVYGYEVVRSYPHDPKAFTQGLIYRDGFLYEGTGGKQSGGKNDPFFSSLRKVEITTGRVLQKYDLPREYFGEGITILGDKVYQLTWQEQTAFVYDLKDFRLLRQLRYSGEGWGLTDDGTNLYMTDGTHVIRVVDPETFKTIRTIVVLDEREKPVMRLNELEWIKGEIWANVWQSDQIMRIDPATGRLLGRIDLSDLTEVEHRANRNADVLNGIAYDEAGDRIFVTGKLWRNLYEIKLKPAQ